MSIKQQHTTRGTLKLEAMAGANVHSAATEAVMIALHEGREVILVHNDAEYIVDPQRIADLAVQNKLH